MEEENNEAMGIGHIHRAITSMPMAPYWSGLIANSKHVTFRTARWKGPLDQGGDNRGRTVWTITPLSVIETGQIAHKKNIPVKYSHIEYV